MMWSPAGGAPSPRAAAAAAVVCLLVTGTLVAHVGHPMSGDPPEPPAAAAASRRVFSAYFRKLTRERRAMLVPPRRSSSPEPLERPSQSDLFLAVKSTQRFHRERLELLLDTWISRSAQQVSTGAGLVLLSRLLLQTLSTSCVEFPEAKRKHVQLWTSESTCWLRGAPLVPHMCYLAQGWRSPLPPPPSQSHASYPPPPQNPTADPLILVVNQRCRPLECMRGRPEGPQAPVCLHNAGRGSRPGWLRRPLDGWGGGPHRFSHCWI